MIWLTSWPGSVAAGLVVGTALWLLTRWRFGKPATVPALAGGLAAFLLLQFVAPAASRALVANDLARVRAETDALRIDLQRARDEQAELLRRLEALDVERRSALARVAALQARDREHVKRRAELDAARLPVPAPVESREEALAIIRRHAGRSWGGNP